MNILRCQQATKVILRRLMPLALYARGALGPCSTFAYSSRPFSAPYSSLFAPGSSLYMDGFRMHVTTSALLGCGYAGVGHAVYGVPLDTAIVAGAMCGFSGMLPDL